MPTAYPNDQDNPDSDESRLEEEHKLLAQGINPKELNPEEAHDLLEDLDDDRTGNHELHDDGDDLARNVTDAEKDGND